MPNVAHERPARARGGISRSVVMMMSERRTRPVRGMHTALRVADLRDDRRTGHTGHQHQHHHTARHLPSVYTESSFLIVLRAVHNNAAPPASIPRAARCSLAHVCTLAWMARSPNRPCAP